MLSPVSQEKWRNETEAIAFEAQVGQLEEDMVLPAGSPATDLVSLESQLTEEVPSGDGSAEEALHVSIPEIIVSSPVPTDDEGSDEGSTFEGYANDVQRKVEDNETERQLTTSNPVLIHPGRCQALVKKKVMYMYLTQIHTQIKRKKTLARNREVASLENTMKLISCHLEAKQTSRLLKRQVLAKNPVKKWQLLANQIALCPRKACMYLTWEREPVAYCHSSGQKSPV